MSNKTQKFTVQFEWGPDTRWLFDANKSRETLESLAQNVATAFTTGPVPAVSVISEEQPETSYAHHH